MIKQPNIKKSKEFAEWIKKIPYDEIAGEDIYDPEIGEIIIYKGDSKNKILKHKKKSAAYDSLRAIEDGTYLDFYKKFRPHAFKEGRINLKDLIKESNRESIYKGDLLKVKVWNYYKLAGINSKNHIGYAVVVDLSPKKEIEKHFTLRVKGWYYQDGTNQWKGFLVNDFKSKDVIEKISINDVPKELRKQIKPFLGK